MTYRIPIAIALGSLLCMAGCAGAKKDSADAAIATSTTEFSAMRVDALKYSPAQAASVEKALQSARDNVAKGDYSTALTIAKDIPSEIQELSASIKDRKDELRQEWEEMNVAVPGLTRAVKTRIDHLERAHKASVRPQEVLAVAQQQWKSANDSYTADDLPAAVDKAHATRGTLIALQTELNSKPEK